VGSAEAVYRFGATLHCAPLPWWLPDYALLALAGQTGLRVSELTGAKIGDIHRGHGPHICCHGKGRKDRVTPLTSHTVTALRAWLAEHRGAPDDPLVTELDQALRIHLSL
jgi:integrase